MIKKRDKTPTKLGIFIKEKREELNISRKQFVNLMPENNKIGSDTLGKIENGIIKRPPDKRLEAFAKILNVDIKILRKLLLLIIISTTTLLSPEAKSIEIIKAFEPENGYHIAFSGGKDSIVIKHLAQKAGVSFTLNMALTTIDPPELLNFNKKYHKDLIYHKPKYSMFKLIIKKGGLPTRQSRYCCQYLKEYVGIGEDLLIMQGIRAEESPNRAKRGIYVIDNRSEQKEKQYLNPIFEWTTKYLWEYIHKNNIPYCSLYDEGFQRLGCVGCPLGSKKNVIKEFQRFPKYKKMYIKAISKARKRLNLKGKPYALKTNFSSSEEAFNWWINQKSIKEYKFDKLQLKLKL